MNNKEEELSVSLQQAREAVAVKDALIRLTKNPDFELVILQGYFKDLAIEQTGILSDESMKDKQDQIHNNLYAISALKRHLEYVLFVGEQQEQAIYEYNNPSEEFGNIIEED